MKTPLFLLVLALAAGGCARRSELQAAKADLAEAQKRIESLEKQRVPRVDYDVTKASLRLADERIAALERELQATRAELAAKSLGSTDAPAAGAGTTLTPTSLTLARGTYETSNGTFVFSPDAQLHFGNHLQISSPSGLLVTDPDQRVVGGDLSIQAKGMTMETEDGLLSAESDGSVKFTGNHLTLRFGEKGTPAPANSPEAVPPADAGQNASGTKPEDAAPVPPL